MNLNLFKPTWTNQMVYALQSRTFHILIFPQPQPNHYFIVDQYYRFYQTFRTFQLVLWF